MKKIWFVISIMFMVIFICNQDLTGSSTKSTINVKIAMVHSWNYQHPSTASQIAGIKKYLRKIENSSIYDDGPAYRFSIINLYLQPKESYTSTVQMKRYGAIAITEVDKFSPHIVITTDDTAWYYTGIPLSSRYPVVYSGINKSITKYLQDDTFKEIVTENVSGVHREIDFNNIFKILELTGSRMSNIHLFINSSTNTSLSSRYIYDEYVRIFNNSSFKGKVIVTPISTDIALISHLKELNKKEKGIIVLALDSIFSVSNNSVYTESDITELLLKYNTKHLEITSNPSLVQKGLSMSIGSCPSDMGYEVGNTVMNRIKDGHFTNIEIDSDSKTVANSVRLRYLNLSYLIDDQHRLVDVIY